MEFDWYKLFNLTEWLATGLVSRTLSVTLDGIGAVDVLVTQGNETSLMYADTFLPVEFQGRNPYVRDGYAVYKDENEDVWLGIEVPA